VNVALVPALVRIAPAQGGDVVLVPVNDAACRDHVVPALVVNTLHVLVANALGPVIVAAALDHDVPVPVAESILVPPDHEASVPDHDIVVAPHGHVVHALMVLVVVEEVEAALEEAVAMANAPDRGSVARSPIALALHAREANAALHRHHL